MKYFISAEELSSSRNENYIEFLHEDTDDVFGGNDSIYMTEATMAVSGLCEFWVDCVHKDIVFDMDTLSRDALVIMKDAATGFNRGICEIISELLCWLDQHSSQGAKSITVIWLSDRTMERRGLLREKFLLDPVFYVDVQSISTELPFDIQQDEYEHLPQKYDIPECLFPFPICEPDKWE